MSKPRYVSAGVVACTVLASCAAHVAKPQLRIEPLAEIRGAGGSESLLARATIGAVRSDPVSRGAYHEKRGELDRALQAYGAAITADYQNVEARSAMAGIYLRKGQVAEAQWLLQEAIAQKPEAAFLHNNLGYVNHLAGDHSAAVKALQTALRIDPSNEWARNNLQLAQDAIAQPSPQATPPARNVSTAAAAPFEVWGQAGGEQNELPKASLPEAAVVTALTAEPIVATAAPVTEDLVPTPSKDFRLEVCNSSGVAGLAKRLSDALGRMGVKVAGVTSQRPFNRLVTEVQYRQGFEVEARRLADKLPGQFATTRVSALDAADIRIVLGKGLSSHIETIETQSFVAGNPAAAPVNTPSASVVAAIAVDAHEPIGERTDAAASFGLKSFELHVVNANGVRGIAGKASGYLRAKGLTARWVGDERPFRSQTQIEYREGYLLEAARLRAALPNQPVIVKIDSGVGTADIKLVLGRDLAVGPETFSSPDGNATYSLGEISPKPDRQGERG